jgi:hypothetical protein
MEALPMPEDEKTILRRAQDEPRVTPATDPRASATQ